MHWHVDLPRLASGRRPAYRSSPFSTRSNLAAAARCSGRLTPPAQPRAVPESEGPHLLGSVGNRSSRRAVLRSSTTREDRARFLGQIGAVGDVTLEVTELTGSPGDAYFTDLRVLHTDRPNAAESPRMMATHRFVPVEVMHELAAALEWEAERGAATALWENVTENCRRLLLPFDPHDIGWRSLCREPSRAWRSGSDRFWSMQASSLSLRWRGPRPCW